jgi:hypothetical protein
MENTVGIWIAGILSLVIFSFLYKDNPAYKVAEHLFLGVALGWGLTLYYWENVFPNAFAPLFYPAEGATRDYWVLIPMILGIFVLLRLVPKLAWLSRYSFAVYIGGAVGISVPTVLAGNFLPQLVDTLQPLYAPAGYAGSEIWYIAMRVLMLVGVFATLLYFFYSIEHKGAVGTISRVGVYFLMLGFGASFGNTVMARVSLLIGRFQFLLFDWIQGVIFRGG